MEKDNEEISLAQFITIPLKKWKLSLFLFLCFLVAGYAIFSIVKVKEEKRQRNLIVNEVSMGYNWVTHPGNNTQFRGYTDYSAEENANLVFDEGKLPEKLSQWPALVCEKKNEILLFSAQDKEIFKIIILTDNTFYKVKFKTEVVTDENNRNKPEILSKDDINKINDIVVDTFIKQANVKILNYRNIRLLMNQARSLLEQKKIVTMDDLKMVSRVSEIMSAYANIEKEYRRTVVNADGLKYTDDIAVSDQKFFSLLLIGAFFTGLMFVYILHFIKESAILREIKESLDESGQGNS